MAEIYSSSFSGQHNDEYNNRLTILEALNLDNKIIKLDQLLSIGSIYETNNNINPSSVLGGNWVEIEKYINTPEQPLLHHLQCKFVGNSMFVKIYEHNNCAGNLLWYSLSEVWSFNAPGKFCMWKALNNRDIFATSSNKYEFILEYPDDSPTQYNHWVQTNNPINDWVTTSTSAKATGYSAIHIDWTENYWGGLVRQYENATTVPSNTYITGTTGIGDWFYAICPFNSWGVGIPSSESLKSITSNSTAGRCIVWCKIQECSYITK